MGKFIFIVSVASCFSAARCFEADDHFNLIQRSASPMRQNPEETEEEETNPIELNSHVAAQWGGNNLWYSGSVLSISNSSTCNILPDNGLTPVGQMLISAVSFC
jgi:hypothetical protein